MSLRVLILTTLFAFRAQATVPVGCPQQLWDVLQPVRGHLSSEMDWARFYRENPTEIYRWGEQFEWFEKVDPQCFVKVSEAVQAGAPLDALEQILREYGAPAFVMGNLGAVQNLRVVQETGFKVETFVRRLSVAEVNAIPALGVAGALGNEWLRSLVSALRIQGRSSAVNMRHVGDGARAVQQTRRVADLRHSDALIAFLKLVHKTFEADLQAGVIASQDMKREFGRFMARSKWIVWKKEPVAAMERFLQEVFAHRFVEQPKVRPDQVEDMLRQQAAHAFVPIYRAEAARQLANPVPISSSASQTPVAKLTPVQPQQARGCGSRLREKRSNASATAPPSKAPQAAPCVRVEILRPSDIPRGRFVDERSRLEFLHWLNVDAVTVRTSILHRLSMLENESMEVVMRSGHVTPTSRNPRVWRIKTANKTRVAIYYPQSGDYRIVAWDESAKSSYDRMNRLIDLAADIIDRL